MFAAVGWIALLLSLSQALPVGEMFFALTTLALAEALAKLLLATSRARLGRGGNGLAQVMTGWVVITCLFAECWFLGLLPFFDHSAYALPCCLGLVLVLTLAHLLAPPGRLRQLLAARWLGLAGGVFAASQIADLTQEATLALALLAGLCLLAVICHAAMRGPPAPPVATPHWWWPVDIVLLPLLLSPAAAASYLIPRALAQLPMLLAAHVEERAAQAMTPHAGVNWLAWLAPRMARLNLGVLLVGGGAAVAVLALAPQLPRLTPALSGLSAEMTLWLVLGASGMALFGAGDFALRKLRWDGLRIGLQLGRVALLVLCLFVMGAQDPLGMAKGFALAHLTTDAAAALLLIRYAGIWPGITAVFLKKIRLF